MDAVLRSENAVEALSVWLGKEDDSKLEFPGRDGRTPLYLCARGGHLQCVEYLLRRGAKVNAYDVSGYTPLHGSVYMGHTDVARILLRAGAEVNPKYRNQVYSPLYWAVLGDKRSCVQVLFEHGARLDDARTLMPHPPEWAVAMERSVIVSRSACQRACIALLGCRGRTRLASRDMCWYIARTLWKTRRLNEWYIIAECESLTQVATRGVANVVVGVSLLREEYVEEHSGSSSDEEPPMPPFDDEEE